MDTVPVLSYRFVYNGVVRHVDNCQFQNSCLAGFEVRRAGKFSFKTKRYALDKIESTLERIAINRANRPEPPTQDNVLMFNRVRQSDAIKDAS